MSSGPTSQPKFCPRCRAVVEGYAPICPACGFDFTQAQYQIQQTPQQGAHYPGQPYHGQPFQEVPRMPVSRHKPSVAFVLSALFPGAGQLYNRQWIKGGILVVVFGFVTLTTPISFSIEEISAWAQQHLPMLLFLSVVGIGSAYDAFSIGVKIRSGRSVSPFEFF